MDCANRQRWGSLSAVRHKKGRLPSRGGPRYSVVSFVDSDGGLHLRSPLLRSNSASSGISGAKDSLKILKGRNYIVLEQTT